MTAALVAAGVAVAVYAGALTALAVAARGPGVRALLTCAAHCVVLVARLARDPAVPRRARAVLLLAALYLACPIDLVPDVIPLVGQLDDALVVIVALRLVLRAVDPAVIGARWPGRDRPPRALVRPARLLRGGAA